MRTLLVKPLFFVLLVLLLWVQLPQRAEAGVSVTDRELVSSRRVGRTTYEYTFRLSVEVNGPALDGLYVYVLCDNPGTTLVDDRVDFGDVPGNQVTVSTDTFTLRQNRRFPLDESCFDYDIGFLETLILRGVATDKPLSDATITATVDRTPSSGRPVVDNSGRPVVDNTTTTTNADGEYELTLEVISETDYITLTAEGTGDQSEALLTSSVGSVETLHDVGAEGSIIVTTSEVGALNITHITTALDELVRRLNGGVLPNTDGAYAALVVQVDGTELLLLATTIKAVIDYPEITLPPGINNTLELIQQDPAVVDAFTEELQTNYPVQFEEALQETASTLGLGYTVDEVVGTLIAAQPSDLPLQNLGAYQFDFGVNGDGTLVFNGGGTPITWTINAAGEIEVVLLDPPVTEGFPFLNPPGAQVRALSFPERLRIVRLADGQTIDQVFVLTTTRTTYPDNPTLPDDVVEQTPDPALVFLTFPEGGNIPVEPADIAGDRIAAYFYHVDNGSVGLGDPRVGADFLNFNADGTGSTERRGFAFSWSTDAVGAVVIDFANGDTNRFLLFNDADVARAVTVASLSDGSRFALSGEVIDRDGSDFSEPNLVNRRYRALFAILDPLFPPPNDLFDFVFLPGGDGCRQVPTSQRLEWESTPEGIADTFLFQGISPTVATQHRSFDAIRVEPGILGPRYYVIENLDFNSIADPNYQYVDPATTPGRINAYEFVEDLTGQADPCGFQPSTITTLLDSNNGGVGNLFDLAATGGTAIRVTGLDVNVAFTAGTNFELTVYTASTSYKNTLSSSVPNRPLFGTCIDTSQWTLVGSAVATAQGQDQPTFVDVPDFVVPLFTTTGVWVTLSRDGSIVDEFRYNTIAGDLTYSGTGLQLTAGAGVVGAAPDQVFSNRLWNGTIYYENQ